MRIKDQYKPILKTPIKTNKNTQKNETIFCSTNMYHQIKRSHKMYTQSSSVRIVVDLCRIIQQKIKENKEKSVKEYYNKLMIQLDISPPVINHHTDFLIQTTLEMVKNYLNSKSDAYKL
jgi:hypothetical protein